MTMPTHVCGFGCTDITPSRPLSMSGFAIRTEPSHGVHDRLAARAAAFSDGSTTAAIVALDLIGVDHELDRSIRDRVADVAGIAGDDVVVAATHTHAGPAILRDAALGTVDGAYRETVIARAADAVAAAVRSAVPATLRIAFGREATVARNRRDPNGPIDPRVPIVWAERDGHVLGAIVSYACHPVTLGPANRLLSRDYPGAVLDALQHALPGAATLFLTGLAGQLNTGHHAHDSQRVGDGPRRTFAEATRLGGLIAAAALEAQRVGGRVLEGPVRMRRTGLALPYAPLPEAPERSAPRWVAERDALGERDPGRRLILEAWIGWAASHGGHVPDHLETTVAALRVGDLVLALHPGEVFVEDGLALQAAFPDHHVIPVGYANDAPGYIPRRDAFATGGYEVEEAYRVYGRPAPFAPEAAEELHRVARDVVADVLR
jgi:neutral ceramidase